MKPKTVVIHFSGEEHRQLTQKKGKQTWHDFVMQLANGGEE